MDAFDLAYRFVADIEKGWSDHPQDHGGRTRYGISQAAHPDVDLDTLTPEGAREIFRRKYWAVRKLRCDRIAAQAGPELATAVFDCAVLHGRRRAGIWLQMAAEKLVGDVRIDGWIGPKTLARLALCDPGRLIALITAARLRFLVALGNRQPDFDDGWIIRVAALLDFIGREKSPQVTLGMGGDK